MLEQWIKNYKENVYILCISRVIRQKKWNVRHLCVSNPIGNTNYTATFFSYQQLHRVDKCTSTLSARHKVYKKNKIKKQKTTTTTIESNWSNFNSHTLPTTIYSYMERCVLNEITKLQLKIQQQQEKSSRGKRE